MAHMKKHQRTACPKCGGNSYVYTFDLEFGYCFLCAYKEHKGAPTHKEKVRSAHIIDIRDYYKQLAHYYHSCLNKTAIEFLHQRGFTNDTIQKFLIGYCPHGSNPLYKNSISVEAGIGLPHDSTSILAGRIIFPYFFNDDTIVDIRGRSIDHNDEIKYKSPYHSSYYRGADYLYNNHLSGANKVLISEGEIKAAISTQVGFAALALPGINSIRTFLQHENQKIIIVFDSQKQNQRFVNLAIEKLAKGIENPHIATLPLMGKNKMDCDTFILEHGAEMFGNIIEGALTYNDWKMLQRF